MKRILLASLLMTTVIAFDVMAKGNNDGKGPGKPEFTNGCLVVDTNAQKGPMANISKADTDSDGCITEDEFKTYMKNNRPKDGKGKGSKQSAE